MPERPIGIYTHTEKTAGVTSVWSAEQAIGKDSIYIWSSKAQRLAKDSDNVIPFQVKNGSPSIETPTPVLSATVSRRFPPASQNRYPYGKTKRTPSGLLVNVTHRMADRCRSQGF
jgi:hypothetical protein